MQRSRVLRFLIEELNVLGGPNVARGELRCLEDLRALAGRSRHVAASKRRFTGLEVSAFMPG